MNEDLTPYLVLLLRADGSLLHPRWGKDGSALIVMALDRMGAWNEAMMATHHEVRATLGNPWAHDGIQGRNYLDVVRCTLVRA